MFTQRRRNHFDALNYLWEPLTLKNFKIESNNATSDEK